MLLDTYAVPFYRRAYKNLPDRSAYAGIPTAGTVSLEGEELWQVHLTAGRSAVQQPSNLPRTVFATHKQIPLQLIPVYPAVGS